MFVAEKHSFSSTPKATASRTIPIEQREIWECCDRSTRRPGVERHADASSRGVVADQRHPSSDLLCIPSLRLSGIRELARSTGALTEPDGSSRGRDRRWTRDNPRRRGTPVCPSRGIPATAGDADADLRTRCQESAGHHSAIWDSGAGVVGFTWGLSDSWGLPLCSDAVFLDSGRAFCAFRQFGAVNAASRRAPPPP